MKKFFILGLGLFLAMGIMSACQDNAKPENSSTSGASLNDAKTVKACKENSI